MEKIDTRHTENLLSSWQSSRHFMWALQCSQIFFVITKQAFQARSLHSTRLRDGTVAQQKRCKDTACNGQGQVRCTSATKNPPKNNLQYQLHKDRSESAAVIAYRSLKGLTHGLPEQWPWHRGTGALWHPLPVLAHGLVLCHHAAMTIWERRLLGWRSTHSLPWTLAR